MLSEIDDGVELDIESDRASQLLVDDVKLAVVLIDGDGLLSHANVDSDADMLEVIVEDRSAVE